MTGALFFDFHVSMRVQPLYRCDAHGTAAGQRRHLQVVIYSLGAMTYARCVGNAVEIVFSIWKN